MPPLNHSMSQENLNKEKEFASSERNSSNPPIMELRDRTQSLRKRFTGRVSQSMNNLSTLKTRTPIATKKKKGRRLVREHFRFDKENRTVLPGALQHDDDLARDVHDFFNLMFLVPIVLLNVLNWDWDALLTTNQFSKSVPFQGCWTGEYFDLFFITTVSYFIIDLVWVVAMPKSVKSPSTIIQHHIATLAYLIIPYQNPSMRFLFGICMSVEINTWFLIARRVFNKQGFPPWTIDLPYLFSVRVKLISICFYITWVAIRCIMYPFVLVIFYKMVNAVTTSESEKVGLAIATCLHAVFCFLNARWTLDLINSKIRYWRTKKKPIETGL